MFESTTDQYEPVTKGRTKNGTMHTKFELRNLTKISEFNERTINSLKRNDRKYNRPNLLREHDVFPAAL